MSLLIFSYFLTVFLFFLSYYYDTQFKKNTGSFNTMTVASGFVSLFAGLSAHLLYTGNMTISTFAFKLCLVSVVVVILTLVKFSFAIPYFTRNVFIHILSVLFLIFGIYLAVFSVESMGWNAKGGFMIHSRRMFGMIDGMVLYTYVFLIGLPAFSLLTLFIRGLSIHSRIYRQQILFVFISICVGLGISLSLYQLSLRFIWAFPLIPFGFVAMIILMYRSISLTTFFDRFLLKATLIDFGVLSIVFSALAGFLAVCVMEFFPQSSFVAVALVVVAVLMLSLRDTIATWLHTFIHVGTDYQLSLEAGFDSLDYTSGKEAVVSKTVSLLEQYVECSSVDMLVSDNKGNLVTVFSSLNARNEVAIENKAIEFLINHNDSLVLKTQAITDHVYESVKSDLMQIFVIGNSDALMLLREGRRVVGIILFGAKKRDGDYTEYDFTVLSKLHSSFFLVMYYLKNIANESVVLTVDREIEFSGQIITSIQENINRITHEKVDVDFITKSARKLGGDFIDFISLNDDKYLFVMGDVSGKGLNASMSMVILKSVIRSFLNETADFKKLVCKVNLFIKNNLPKGTFFAGVFCLMDFNTNTMHYINCGVPAIFLYTAAYNNAIEILGDGRVLGFVRDIEKYLKIKKIVLNPQDIILMTTDGLVDSTNQRGERFGKDRLQRLLMENRALPATRMVGVLCDNLSSFVSRELEDDITVLVFKYLKK